MPKKLKYLILSLLSWFVIHETIITVDGLNDEAGPTEAAVIFGTKVNEDGTLSERLQERLNRGLELYNDSRVELIIVSGGLGKEGHYEGTKMAEYLITKGVKPEHIHIDNNGNNTLLTAENTMTDFPNIKSVTVVSQFYHITRAKLAMKKVGIQEVQGAHCNFYEIRDVYSCFREFFAYYKYLLFV